MCGDCRKRIRREQVTAIADKELARQKQKLVGTVFEGFRVLDYAGTAVLKSGKSVRRWRVRCKCGSIFIRSTNKINRGQPFCTQSGCEYFPFRSGPRNDLTGKRFGKLEVVKIIKQANGHWHWQCLCGCGRYRNVKTGYLSSGSVWNCGHCVTHQTKSFGEWKVAQFFESAGLAYKRQHRLFAFAESGHPCRVDFFVPDWGAVVEYDGKQHFQPVKFFGGDEGYRENRHRDKEKDQWCEKNDLKMIRIGYWERSQINWILSTLSKKPRTRLHSEHRYEQNPVDSERIDGQEVSSSSRFNQSLRSLVAQG